METHDQKCYLYCVHKALGIVRIDITTILFMIWKNMVYIFLQQDNNGKLRRKALNLDFMQTANTEHYKSMQEINKHCMNAGDHKHV